MRKFYCLSQYYNNNSSQLADQIRSFAVNIFISCLLIPGTACFIHVQAQEIAWEVNYGGSGGDYARAMQFTRDGGYVIAGRSASSDGDVGGNHAGADVWVIKLDSTGSLEWENNYGGTEHDYAEAVQPASDGGYVVAGYSYSSDGDLSDNNGESDYWLIKLDSEGNLEWENNYGGLSDDQAYAVQLTADDGYIMAGYTNSSGGDVGSNERGENCWVLKLDQEGNIEWTNHYGGYDIDRAHAVQPAADGGYIVAGYSYSSDGDVSDNNGSADYWVIKLDDSGNLEWENNYGGSSNDIARALQATSDGGCVVTGYSVSADGDIGDANGGADAWVIKLDNAGNLEWENSYGGSATEIAYAIQAASDEGYLMTGYAQSSDGDVSDNQGGSDYWLVKLDQEGNIEWEDNYGGDDDDLAHAVRPAADGSYAISGHSASSNGDVGGNNGNMDYWILKIDPPSTGIASHNFGSDFRVYPNPAGGPVMVELGEKYRKVKAGVYNNSGQKVYSRNYGNTDTFTLKLHNEVSPGTYRLDIKTREGKSASVNIVVQ